LAADHTIAIFIAELTLLLLFGRMLGELMNRVGQPAIFGQLLAGVVLGPSVFGLALPEVRQVIFPGTPALKAMIDAISQIGILLLLLLTGMETNLSLVNRKRRAVISTSFFGIALPFVCGVLLAYALPIELLPSPGARLVTALFLGTALSISSVKIVAVVLMEVGVIRRDLGQLILATAILDDTIAWILIAVIAGIAAHGSLDLANLSISLALTISFLALSLTFGRRLIAWIIRWSNDNLTIEVPVITAILVVMLSMALTTELIGVHTALGAFVAGILIGQSPILTEHIEGELKGLIVAFFSPVFFAVAGLGMDLRTLLDPALLALTLAVIAVASLGKFVGALIGGRLGGLTSPESLALATGLNARGSTEVIVASIGLSMGALSSQLYTMIVAMAVVTTMIMPPTLRWMLSRVPMRDEEARRLEREEAEQREIVPNMERALVHVDASANGKLAASLAGAFAAGQQVLVTATEVEGSTKDDKTGSIGALREAAAAALERSQEQQARDNEPSERNLSLQELIRAKPAGIDGSLAKEAGKGYSIVFIGAERAISRTGDHFEGELQGLAETFEGPIAIALNGASHTTAHLGPLKILVPTAGTPEARLAVEIAIALCKATKGTLTALVVFDPQDESELLRGRARRHGLSVLVDARRLGRRYGVPVKGQSITSARPELAIRRATRTGRFDLVVVGTSLRQGETRFFGPRTAALIRQIDGPLLLVAR
jgi:Kef-type K+ transport system membrane component KefB/nucleotide-binding universal stress UspA family protein